MNQPLPDMEEAIKELTTEEKVHIIAVLSAMTASKFRIGDKVSCGEGVRKVVGTVRAVYLTGARKVRYVLETDVYRLQLVYGETLLVPVLQPLVPEEISVVAPLTESTPRQTRNSMAKTKGRTGTKGRTAKGSAKGSAAVRRAAKKGRRLPT